jgi:hypothetical protein
MPKRAVNPSDIKNKIKRQLVWHRRKADKTKRKRKERMDKKKLIEEGKV